MILIKIKGYAGGGMYGKSGAAAEYVCLPHDPNLITNLALTIHGGTQLIFMEQNTKTMHLVPMCSIMMYHVLFAMLPISHLF